MTPTNKKQQAKENATCKEAAAYIEVSTRKIAKKNSRPKKIAAFAASTTKIPPAKNSKSEAPNKKRVPTENTAAAGTAVSHNNAAPPPAMQTRL